MNEKAEIFFFNKEEREKLSKKNPKNYFPDSHTSINHKFGINDNDADRFELCLKAWKVMVDKFATNRTSENREILQKFVNGKGKEWIKELILASHIVNIADDCPEWLLENGVLNLPNAKVVNCANNQLTNLNLPKAEVVFCYYNKLTNLNLPNARQVDCHNNELIHFELPNAETVNCNYNRLTTLNLPNVETVYCRYNQLVNLELPNVITVACSNNRLTSLDLPRAKWVYCENNYLTNLNVPDARTVHCEDNPELKSKWN
jgi:hypothetical protein